MFNYPNMYSRGKAGNDVIDIFTGDLLSNMLNCVFVTSANSFLERCEKTCLAGPLVCTRFGRYLYVFYEDNCYYGLLDRFFSD